MYEVLRDLLAKPKPYEIMTIKELWTRPHLAKQMLAAHVDGTNDLASRRSSFIEEAAEFLRSQVSDKATVLDLGCGPGLYTKALAKKELQVYGMDFSSLSIGYAKETGSSNTQYVLGDYLEDPFPVKADLITMIYCDYCALSPHGRKVLLDKVKRALKANGRFIFDVHHLTYFEKKKESRQISHYEHGGFFSQAPHLVLEQRHLYHGEYISLDRYDVFEERASYTLYNWLKHFSPESLQEELEASGFQVIDLYDDLTGKPFTGTADDFAVICKLRKEA